jgi:hypothetical protein
LGVVVLMSAFCGYASLYKNDAQGCNAFEKSKKMNYFTKKTKVSTLVRLAPLGTYTTNLSGSYKRHS